MDAAAAYRLQASILTGAASRHERRPLVPFPVRGGFRLRIRLLVMLRLRRCRSLPYKGGGPGQSIEN
jgi:hypothetical protein